MRDKRTVRDAIWGRLTDVALADPRYGLDFGQFIPDFVGRPAALARLTALPAYQRARVVLVTPDNSTKPLREQAASDGKVVITPSGGLWNGFLRVSSPPSAGEPIGDATPALEPVGLPALQQLGPIDLFVTGAAGIAAGGVRLGKGHGYCDLEWAILMRIGVVSTRTPVAAVVHDCQVVDDAVAAAPFDVGCDIVCTPTRALCFPEAAKPSAGVLWAELDAARIAAMPPLRELRALEQSERTPPTG